MTSTAAQTVIDQLRSEGLVPSDFAFTARSAEDLDALAAALRTASQDSYTNLRDATDSDIETFLGAMLREATGDRERSPLHVAIEIASAECGLGSFDALRAYVGRMFSDLMAICREVWAAANGKEQVRARPLRADDPNVAARQPMPDLSLNDMQAANIMRLVGEIGYEDAVRRLSA